MIVTNVGHIVLKQNTLNQTTLRITCNHCKVSNFFEKLDTIHIP